MTSLRRTLRVAAIGILMTFACAANAADPEKKLSAGAKTAIETAFNVQVKSSEPAKIGGLLEVLTDRGIVYTDPAGEFVLVNAAMLETRTKQNLTAQRLDALSAYSFDAFPLADAIKVVRGKGTRKLVVFEDPNCGYCKQFERSLEKVEDVTAYILLTPVLGPDSVAKSKMIWCAADRAKAWRDQMVSSIAPNGRQDCETPVERNLALFSKLYLRGTPSIYFPSGYHTPGAIPAEEIEKHLTPTKKVDQEAVKSTAGR